MDFNEIRQELRGNHLATVFPSIRSKAASIGNWEVAEEVETLWMTYQQMLQFMLDGMKDPQSQQIRKRICHDLLVATAKLERLERLKNHVGERYVNAQKELKNIPTFESLVNSLETVSMDIANMERDELVRDTVRQYNLEQVHEATLLQLFHWIWTSEIWQNNDVEQANRILFSDYINSHDKSLFVSAVTLSLLEYNDILKVLFLLDCYLVEDLAVSQRALIGFVIVFYLSFDQLRDNSELFDRLMVYRDDATFVHDVYSIMMLLQFSCTTDRIASKMRNDIIPAIMQGQMKNATNQTKIDTEEFTKHGENPEWIDDAKVNKKMREMANLQLDGADIYYSSFAMLKGYTFFGQLPHWFYPFSFNTILVPELKQVLSGKMGKLVKLLLKGSPFCNSDKYSICFTFKTLGRFGEDAVEAQLNQQLDGESINQLIEDAETTQPSKIDICRQYIFDLYRFFYVYPYKQQFVNPFEALKREPITPYSNDWLAILLGEEEEEKAHYADFLMRKEFYGTALQMFESLRKNEFEEVYADVWQKIGFCHQKLKRTEDAIHAYETANSLKPNSKWTLTHLVSLYVHQGDVVKAVKLYQELLDIEPNNLKFLFGMAQALMNSGDNEGAQRYLYKALYIDDTSVSVKLLLSWCLIMSKQNGQASKYVSEVLAKDAQNKEAQLLVALVQLCEGHVREAYSLLKPFINDAVKDEIMEKLSTLAKQDIISCATATLFMDALMLNID